MDQNKNRKFQIYCSEVIKKYGVILPVFCAIAAFAILFYMHFVGMFDSLEARGALAFWLTVGGGVVGIGLMLAYIITKIKDKDIGFADAMLFTILVLLVFVFVGIIIFDFLALETVYFGISFLITLALIAVRVILSEPERTEIQKVSPNVTFKKYFTSLIGKYGFWTLFLPALGILGALLLSDANSFPELFLSKTEYTVGLLIVAALALAAIVFGLIKRMNKCRIDSSDAVMAIIFFSVILGVIRVLVVFNVLNLVLWFAALCVVITLLRILGVNTRIDEEATDDSFFATESNNKYVKNPKIFFKHLYANYNILLLCSIALLIFAIMNALVVTDFFGWANANKFMVFAVIALAIYYIYGLVYFSRRLKLHDIGNQDAALVILDISLLLLTISVLANLQADGIMVSLILWAVSFAFSVAFTIVRFFMVREVVSEELPNIEELDEKQLSETIESSEDSSKENKTEEAEKISEEIDRNDDESKKNL